MKRISKMILLSAGILLTLAGCQKGTTTNDLTGKAVRFGVTSGSLSTRTSFTGEGTQDGTKVDDFGRKILTWERLSWAAGDQIMVASDYATVYQSSVKSATYTVGTITDDGDKSYATLKEKDSSEELYFNENETYKFWGVYPASVGDGTKLVNAQAEFAVSASQAPSGDAVKTTVEGKSITLTTLPADMTQAVMLGAAENQTSSNVELEFYPAFTAFEFTLNSLTSDLILKELILTTAEGKSLAGTVEVNAIKTGGTTFASTDNYGISYPDDKKVTYSFPDDTKITKDDYLTFTVYALPETINGLTLEFHLGEDGSEIQKATLKYQGNPIEFAACKKHNLRGIAVKGGWNFEYLTLDIDVLDWVELEIEQSNGSGVQATQFSMSFNDTADADDHCLRYVKGNDKDYRQCWVFDPTFTTGEGDEATTKATEITVKYKIMMPTSGSWSIEKCGDTGSFTVAVESTSGEVDSEGNTYSGSLIATGPTYITITITSNATDLKTLYFKTFVSDGTSSFSLDSETQLYDMRGYHYFIVNGKASTTFDDLNI